MVFPDSMEKVQGITRMGNSHQDILVLFAYLPKKIGPHFYSKYYASLPFSIRVKLSQYYCEKDRLAGIIGKTLLKEGLRKLGMDSSVLEEMQYTASHRPYLPLASWIDFNISHSGTLVACAISSTLRVGIDVEKEKPIGIVNFQSSFSAGQWEMLESAPDPQKMFYQLWTQKEALVKADGLEQTVSFSDIEIIENTSFIHQRRWFLFPLAIDPLYSAWLATSTIGNVTVEQLFF